MGGEVLSSYVLLKDLERSRKGWARGGRRLLDALRRGPPRQHLALPLFILVAQQRQAVMVGGWGGWGGQHSIRHGHSSCGLVLGSTAMPAAMPAAPLPTAHVVIKTRYHRDLSQLVVPPLSSPPALTRPLPPAPSCFQIHTEAQNIKFVMSLYDKCHETCFQYLEFLQVRHTFGCGGAL